MDDLMTTFGDYLPLFVFCLVCYAVVHALRTLVETLRPDVIGKKWWNPILLRALPVAFGVVGAMPHLKYPFPAAISATSYRLAVGFLLGSFSTVGYKIFRLYVAKKVGIDVEAPSVDSPPPGGPKP